MSLLVHWQAIYTLVILVLALIALIRNIAPPDAVFLGSVVLYAIAGIISPHEAFSGFANEGVLAVGALFVVAAGLQQTGLLGFIGHHLLGAVRTERVVLARLAALVLPLSAFLNNTPIVAMLMPVVVDWCRKRSISPSRLLMPLSYLAILGGVCTLIGTSTNLVVHGLMVEAARDAADWAARHPGVDPATLATRLRGMSMFEISRLGIPFALVGTAYLFLARPLFPQRKELLEQFGERRREYMAEMVVQPGCRLAGRTVETCGLRNLPGLFLVEINRADQAITPVGPQDVIQEGDHLVFSGIVSTIVDLERIPGLAPAVDATYDGAGDGRRARQLSEAVISPTSPLIGVKVRDSNFRALYDAAIVAIHRGGARLNTKIGEVALRPGDTLLLQTGADFARRHRNHPDFYLVSDVEDSAPPRHARMPVAIVLFLVLIALMSSGVIPISVAALLVAGLMVLFRCMSAADARKSVEWQVLVTIAASFGAGAALKNSGAAHFLAQSLVQLTAGAGPVVGLAATFFVTTVLTAVITNNAAAVLMFPIVLDAALQFGVNPRGWLFALALGASTCFISPIGYQTNMMVYGPGGYRFTDFLRVGGPMQLALLAVVMALTPWLWP
ncbi:MAG TPA: SLC13 family permease [Candidatus Sumerlaeota bacterium]|nr:SLC13 family permease [Candidatus Sumerlaeota bacterium]HPK01967.1 SLC13 family permease [Candidatus Sumerlaeota bacterium]